MSRVIDRWKWACTVAAPRLSGAQRAVLHVLVAHAPNGTTIVGQDTMADSAGIDVRNVRPALAMLERLGLISGEPRPGKATVWTINAAWTPDADFRGQRPRQGIGGRNSTSGVTTADPGWTPDGPRNSASDGSRRERTSTATPSLSTAARHAGEGEVEFDPNDLPRPRRLAA